jgi:tetratricopeptide (TPR) repeat protein
MDAIRTKRLCIVLVALTVIVYLPVWRNDFVNFDDESYITANQHVIGGLSRSGFSWAWGNLHARYWQPLSWLSLQFDAHFFSSRQLDGSIRLSPAAFHGQNLFWHCASTVALFGLLQRLTGAPWRSFLVAALFALHPMHVESVAWATERKDVLSVFFGIATLAAYVRYVEKPNWKRYLGMTVLFLLSLLSKPMLITLPFVLLLLDYWPLRRMFAASSPLEAEGGVTLPRASWRRLLFEKVPMFFIAAAIGMVTLLARKQTGAMVSLTDLPLSARLGNALTAYSWYLLATFRPCELAVFYPHPNVNWSLPSALAGAATLLVLTALTVWQARRRRWLVVGWLWFAGSLLPVIGLAQGGMQAWADRFSYWPHIGLFLAIVWAGAELVERFRVPALVSAGIGAAILGSLGVLTWIQVGYWHDTATLWHRVLAVTKDNAYAYVNLGKYHLDRGELSDAESHFAEAVRISPDAPDYHDFLGVALLSLGKTAEAGDQFRETLVRDPTNTDAWHNLGIARLRQGQTQKAILHFRKVLEMQPESLDVLTALGLALLREGKRQEAEDIFNDVLRRNPSEADACRGLGLVRLARGEWEEAINAFRKALRFNPQLLKAYNDLGVALCRRGLWAHAVPYLYQAVVSQEQVEKHLTRMNGRLPETESIPQIVFYRCQLAFALNRLGELRASSGEYREALKRDPSWPRKFTAKAWELTTAPDVNFRDPHLAFELASQAIEAGNKPSAAMLDTLAAAQAALGQFSEAVQTAEQALKTISDTEPTLVEGIRSRLRLYKQGKMAERLLLSPTSTIHPEPSHAP